MTRRVRQILICMGAILLVALMLQIWPKTSPAPLAEARTEDVTALQKLFGGNGCGPACETNPGLPVSLIVIGDSHAQQYYAGFKAALPDRNVKIFHYSSCQMFSLEYARDFSELGDAAQKYRDGCTKARAEAFDQIRSTHVPVIVAGYWANYTYNGMKAPADLTDLVASEAARLKVDLNIPTLTLFGSIPGSGSDRGAATCMANSGSDAACVTSVKAAFQSDRAAINARLASKLAPDIGFVDPFHALCKAGSCPEMLDGKPVYTDRTHLTKYAAERVVALGMKAWGM